MPRGGPQLPTVSDAALQLIFANVIFADIIFASIARNALCCAIALASPWYTLHGDCSPLASHAARRSKTTVSSLRF